MLEEWLTQPIEVIPAVDVLGDGAVRLHQGDYDAVVERAGEPVALARRFAEAGARRDPPRRPRRRALRTRAARARAARRRGRGAGAPSGLGRDPLARGRARRCSPRAPTASSSAPPRCRATPRPGSRRSARGSSIALDVRDGQVRTAGWTEGSGLSLGGRGRALPRRGRHARPLHGDRPRRDARRPRPRAGARASPARACSVLAAGGVRSPADVAALAEAGAEAAVVGRALLG